MPGIDPSPPFWPGGNLAVVTANPTADIPDIPSNGCKIHNTGTSGTVNVDGAVSGQDVPLYLRQGDFAPVLVRRVRSIGGGVTIVAVW